MTRILSAAVLAPLVLLAIHAGGLWLAAFMAAAGAVMGWEWARLCNGGSLGPAGLVAMATLAGLPPAFLYGVPAALALLAAGVALCGVALCGVVLCGVAPALAGARRDLLWLPLGTAYLGLACLALLWLRSVPPEGRDLLFWLFAVVWATDSGAFFAGRAIGGPRLAPRISPNKTWAGLIGGTLSAALVGVLAAGLLGRDALLLVVGGMLLAVVAQGGDLLESWCKRRFGVKDSGHIMPGHGGILDRVDGLLAVLPVAFLYLWASTSGQ